MIYSVDKVETDRTNQRMVRSNQVFPVQHPPTPTLKCQGYNNGLSGQNLNFIPLNYEHTHKHCKIVKLLKKGSQIKFASFM